MPPESTSARPRRLLIILSVGLFVLLALLAVYFILPRLRPPILHGMVLQAPEPVADVALTAHTGERVQLSDFRGKNVIVYFGYTFCPDVCPLTLAQIGQAMRLIGDKADDVQVLMISVDPERDTPAHLAEYVPVFNPNFLGLTGTLDEIQRAATLFGVYFQKQDVEGASGYLVDHTATIMLLDKDGRMRLVWPPGVTGEEMAEDLQVMMR